MSTTPTVIDLFAGAGGFGLGFSKAEYDLLYSLESDKWAADTLGQNNSHSIINDDILNFSSKAKIYSIIKDKPDIIIGGPPCQGFSNAGKKKESDPRNKLYLEYLYWVKLFRPKIFIIENVKGILSFKNSKNQKIIDDIINQIKSVGYKATIWKLNAANYGVPQNRERVFIIGHTSLENIPYPPKTHAIDSLFPSPVTVLEAIGDLPKIMAKEGEEEMEYENGILTAYQKKMRKGSPKVFNHVAMKHTDRVVERYKKIIEGEKLEDLHDDLKVRKRNGNGALSDASFSLNYRYLNPHQSSYTIPAHFYSSFIHPHIPRNITTREAARIQSFPDWYKFMGKRTMISSKLLKRLGKEELNFLSQYNQVGNAVPPLLAEVIGKHLKSFI
ncbi:DNA cytosine methyltransferase [Aequorivita viscosa]|nr:DNA cytosine methyltransferase [Aequorivita viscosa]